MPQIPSQITNYVFFFENRTGTVSFPYILTYILPYGTLNVFPEDYFPSKKISEYVACFKTTLCHLSVHISLTSLLCTMTSSIGNSTLSLSGDSSIIIILWYQSPQHAFSGLPDSVA